QQRQCAAGPDYVRLHAEELGHLGPDAFGAAVSPPIIHDDIGAFRPTALLQTLAKCRPAKLRFRIVLSYRLKDADPPHALALLRAGVTRPRGRAAEQRYKRASLHSITSSARLINACGRPRPSAFAVLRLITSSYLVGACTGRSAGFSPLRMRSTEAAARRCGSVESDPEAASPPAFAKKRNE